MQTERRSAPRQGLNSLIYLDLEPDNGGILLNLSEGGMQISVANRLVTSSEIHFTLRLDPKETISGTGRVAWLSPSGRSAGVHFLGLPEEARREIRQWMGVNADSSSAEPADDQQEGAEGKPQTEEAVAAPPAPEPIPAAPTVETETILPVEMEEAKAEEAKMEIPPPPPTETLQPESPEPSALVDMQPAPEPAMEAVEPESFVPEPPNRVPEPEDALVLLESTVEKREIEEAPNTWEPAVVAPAASAIDGDGETSSVLSLYGMDGQENISVQNPPEQLTESTDGRQPIGAAYPQNWTADRPLHSFRPAGESGHKSRRARARARRKKAAHKHPSILLSPIFVPAPPPSEFLPPPDPEKLYQPITEPVEDPPAEPLPIAPAQSSADASLAPLTMPEPPAEPSDLKPGALYLPNYRIDTIAPVEARKTSWKDLFRKPKDCFRRPPLRDSGVFERFEEFGWSLESDWHVWLSLILLLAGFLSLAQKPPLIVLTIAFWFASAVVISERRRPHHGKRQHQKSGRR